MQLLDAVRLVAAVGVIVSHVTSELFPGNLLWAIGSFSVPFYLFAALYFTVRGFKKDPDRSSGGYLLGRIARLYLPFLVWNVAYEVMYKLKHPEMPMQPLPNLLWAASYAHLYFLPLLGCATALVVLLMRPIQSSLAFRVGLTVVLTIGAVACASFWQPAPPFQPTPIEQTIFQVQRALAPAMLAIVFAIWAGTRAKAFAVGPKIGLLGCALMLAALASQIRVDHPLMRALSGFGLVLIAFTPAHFAVLRPVAAIGRYSYGIYLSHVAFIRVAFMIANYFAFGTSVGLAVAIGLFSLVGGAILSVLLARSKWTAWIVGCDIGKSERATLTTPAPSSLPQTAPLQTPDRLENVPR